MCPDGTATKVAEEGRFPESRTRSDGGGAIALLAALLSKFPSARIGAINESGIAVPVPDIVPRTGHRVLDSSFDAVVLADHMAVIDLYARARNSAAASGIVHLVEDPDRPVTVYIVDCRRRYQALIVVFIDGVDEEAGLIGAAALPQLPTRLARAHKDLSAIYVAVDTAMTEILGWSADQLVGRRALEIVHPDDRDIAIANWVEMLSTPGLGRRVRLRHQHRDGRWVWLEITNHNRLADPTHGDVMAEMVDISEEMAAHEALEAREQLLHELAQTVPLGLFHCDRAGNVLFANERLCDILEVGHIREIGDLVAAVDPNDRPAVHQAILRILASQVEADLELRILRSGAPRYAALRLRATARATAALSGMIGCIEDVTEAVAMRRRLEVQATLDSLTQCHNRSSTLAKITASIEDLRAPHQTGIAALYFDLDRFKPVNDAFGHGVGDQVLIAVAERLQGAIRTGDLVGRIGGDEFVVICPGVHSPAHALRIGEALAERLCGPVQVGTREVQIAASIGIAWTDDGDLAPKALLDAADAAMYRSKRVGRCRPVLADAKS